jgi:Spy/CpxP family protein refolding chaperone
MKPLFPLLILIASSMAIAGTPESPESASTPFETAAVGRSPNDIVDQLAQRLSLTDDQKSKILPIITDRRRKIQDVRTHSTQFVRQKRGQIRGIYEDSDRRINALLTGEQQKAYAALEQEMKIQHRTRRSQSATTAD